MARRNSFRRVTACTVQLLYAAFCFVLQREQPAGIIPGYSAIPTSTRVVLAYLTVRHSRVRLAVM